LRRHVQAQDFRKTSICEEQALGSIHDGHAFHHASENRRRKIAFFGQRLNAAVEPCGRRIQRNRQCFQGVAGAIRFQRTKIAFRDAMKKIREPVHAIRERTRDEQRRGPGNEEHEQ